jgi:Zn-dependent protease with chaperone function
MLASRLRSSSLRRLHIRFDSCVHALLAVAGLAAVAGGSGCGTALLAPRSPLQTIPESQETALGIRAYEQLLADEPASQDEQLVAQVNRVGQRLAAAADKSRFDWEFRVIAEDELHSCALPGGKVAVSEGLLTVCQDEAGLAVVLSHAMAHVLARHGSERISPPAVHPGLRGALQTLTRAPVTTVTPQEIIQVYGADPQPGEQLPYSRKLETEADAIGLILMAKGGYDPSAAPEFWDRLARRSEDNRSRWIATHPADAYRTTQLRAMLPVAMNYYDAAPEHLGLGDVLRLSDRSPAALADIAPQLRNPTTREQNPARVAHTSTVPRHASPGITQGASQDASQNASHGATQAGSADATEIAGAPPNEWVAGSKSPPTRKKRAAYGVARVRSEAAQPARDMPQAETGTPSAQPTTTPPSATDDDVFYPPIAVSSGATRE